jgi:hypothetical protein
MWVAILQALGLVVAAIVGARAAHQWQLRSSRESRFFEASRSAHDKMAATSEKIVKLAGRRLFYTQRLMLADASSMNYDQHMRDFRVSVQEWNEMLFEMELGVRSLFENARLSDFEALQSRLATLTTKVVRDLKVRRQSSNLLVALNTLRGDYFQFVQEMNREIKLLHRQMHFGVRLPYDELEIGRYSTKELLAALLAGPEKNHSVIRSPSDLGKPILSGEARFGVNEH